MENLNNYAQKLRFKCTLPYGKLSLKEDNHTILLNMQSVSKLHKQISSVYTATKK